MKAFAEAYLDLQFVQVALAQIVLVPQSHLKNLTAIDIIWADRTKFYLSSFSNSIALISMRVIEAITSFLGAASFSL